MYWSGDRLWERCGKVEERMGSYFAYILYSIHLKCYRTSANVFLGSYSLMLMKQPNTVASYGSRGRERQGWYVRFSV